jgi:Zn-finger nucleic acid-binding protein
VRCPVCRTALVVVEREGIELDWCLTCRGLWFDQGELELLAETSGRAIDSGSLSRSAAQGSAKRRCPRCRRKMHPATVGSEEAVQIDACPDHGIWLDRGELGRILSDPSVGDGPLQRFLGETFRPQ